jgi:hypothetical protein
VLGLWKREDCPPIAIRGHDTRKGKKRKTTGSAPIGIRTSRSASCGT